MGDEIYSDFGAFFKNILNEKNIKMSNISKITGIDKATISRIANNKQKPNINHLEKISKVLDISLNDLLIAAGHDVNVKNNNQKIDKDLEFDYNCDFTNETDILNFSNMINDEKLVKNIETELKKYQMYVNTESGKEAVLKKFDDKIKSVHGEGAFLNTLKNMYKEYCSRGLTAKEYMILGSALLYFITTVDIIPDFIFPIGFIDDMMAINLVLNMIKPTR